MKCPNCNTEIGETMKFCPECGTCVSQKKVCGKCGAELSDNAKFCPECGTPYGCTDVIVQDEDSNKQIFVITQSNFDELALGNDYKLISFDNVSSENEKVADVIIDDEDDVVIKAFTRGKVRIGIAFTYMDKSKTCHEATWVGVFRVKVGNEIVIEDSGFLDDEEENNNASKVDDSGSMLKNVIGGIGAFAGAFLGGLAGNFDNDDDY